MEWDIPLIIVGTVTGGTRTVTVYRASDKNQISSMTQPGDGNNIPSGSAPICIGLTEMYHTSNICAFRGEYEEVMVYDRLLSTAEKDEIVSYLAKADEAP